MEQVKGHIVDIQNQKIIKGIVSFQNGKINSIIPTDDVPDQYIIPGFIDAHVHVESSMLIPSEFARLAVKQGTVATISDPHEIGNVLGKNGVEFMIENGNKTPFKFFFGAPSCVPATPFETAGATINLQDIEELFQLPRVNYLAEMMNFPGVLHRDKDVMDKIELAHSLQKRVDGHAPGLKGKDAEKYASAGIETDHECFTKEEALGKLECGMKILIREGSAAKNFEALWTLIDEFPDRIMLCSDDKHPNDFVVGHINQLAARAVAKGCDVFNVLQTACINPIDHYNMDVGQLKDGDPADFCVVADLTDFNVLQTYIDGVKVYGDKRVLFPRVDEETPNNFTCEPIDSSQLKVKSTQGKVRVIQVEDGQLMTQEKHVTLPTKDGELLADPDQDVLKVVVVNRYKTAPPAVAFITNFGFQEGAIASCVAHDSHNIIAVGTTDEDIICAINLIIAQKGGISLANKTEREVLPLPVAGIMTTEDGTAVAQKYEALDKRSKELGATLTSPYMTLSFCALLVIPQLKLSDKGLFDGSKFEFVDLNF